MTGEQYKAVTDFEAGLQVGKPVAVCWTNSHQRFRGQGTVSKINKKSIRVRLTQDVPCPYAEPYRAGREIIVPSIENITDWSANNRVEPENGYPPV